MAHRSSAAALHAARVILKEFELEPKPLETLPSGRIPNLRGDDAHLSIIIDYATNLHKVVELRPELQWFQKRLKVSGSVTAGQVIAYLRKMLDTFALMPQDPTDAPKIVVNIIMPTEFNVGNTVKHVISKSAREVTRFIFYYYFVKPKRGTTDEVIDKDKVMRMAELSTGISRILKLIPYIKDHLDLLQQGQATEKDIRLCFREIGVVMTAALPDYGINEEETKLLV